MTPLFSDEPGWESGREVQDRIAARLGRVQEGAEAGDPAGAPRGRDGGNALTGKRIRRSWNG